MMKIASQNLGPVRPTVLAAHELPGASGARDELDGIDYIPPGYLSVDSVVKDHKEFTTWLGHMKEKYPGFGDLSYKDAWENGVWPKKPA